jgi:hypothetical protein
MKRLFGALICCVVGVSAAVGQDLGPGYTTYLPVTRIAPENSAAAQFSAAINPTPLPSFSYTIQASAALGGGVFSGSIIGRSPLDQRKTRTTIPTQLIPLIITIGGVTYDPTQPDACVTGNPTDVSIIAHSPIFTNNAWVMNGVNVMRTSAPSSGRWSKERITI